ncbi:hypothetical protein [Herpetosiphon sp. NSE202]|uniref:hypothetical protein n=1 Tax=Herpetosiphon sp. NSE202 TaxID=3351349 RepID=UPI003633D70C
MNIFERFRIIGLGLQATKQIMTLIEHATLEPRSPTASADADSLSVGTLLVPVTDSVAKVAVLYGLSGLSALLNAVKSGDDVANPQAQVAWGAFQKSQVNAGQVWRILTYSLVHPSFAQALRESAAMGILGTATTRFQSFSLAFSAVRLGIFVPLLVTAPQADNDTVLINMSGSSYCLLGVFLASLATDRDRLSVHSQSDVLAATGLGVLSTQMLVRLLRSSGQTRKAGLASLGAGIVSTVIMQIVRRVNANKAE